MATANRKTDGKRKVRNAAKAAPAGETSGEKKISCALQVLREGLRTIDDAADLIRGALIDMEMGVSAPGKTGQHLNGVGKVIQMKKMKDSAVGLVKKGAEKAASLPGSGRKFA